MSDNKPHFVVSAIAYEDSPRKGHISCLEVRRCDGDLVGPATLLTRRDVVDLLDQDFDVQTFFKDKAGNWKRQPVHKVKTAGGVFLRTLGDGIAADDLASMLEFDPSMPPAVPRL